MMAMLSLTEKLVRAVGRSRVHATGARTVHVRRPTTLRSPDSGVTLKLHTTQAGLQVYSGANLGAPFRPGAGICLEAQGFPDAPNKAGFPSTTLAAGETYRQRTVYEFTVEPV